MTRFPIWGLEWRLGLRRRRLFVLNVTIPLLLVVPLIAAGAPAFHSAAAITVLFVLFGIFGSAIPLLRDGEGGILRRFVLTGGSEGGILTQRLLASACLDFLQLLPSLAVVLLAGEGSIWPLAAAILFPSLLAANLIGAWVAAGARSLAEGALFAAVTGLFLLHGSGVFRTATPGTAGALLETWLPFGPLHRTLLAATGGGPPPAEPLVAIMLPLSSGAVLLLVTGLFARFLIERIAPAIRP